MELDDELELLETRIESNPRSSVGLDRYVCSNYFKKYIFKGSFFKTNELQHVINIGYACRWGTITSCLNKAVL